MLSRINQSLLNDLKFCADLLDEQLHAGNFHTAKIQAAKLLKLIEALETALKVAS